MELLRYKNFCLVIICGGAGLASIDLAYSTELFHLSPDDGRVVFMNCSHSFTFSGKALAPYIVGLVLSHFLGTKAFQGIYLICGIILFLSLPFSLYFHNLAKR